MVILVKAELLDILARVERQAILENLESVELLVIAE